jgi:hypothetical protein
MPVQLLENTIEVHFHTAAQQWHLRTPAQEKLKRSYPVSSAATRCPFPWTASLQRQMPTGRRTLHHALHSKQHNLPLHLPRWHSSLRPMGHSLPSSARRKDHYLAIVWLPYKWSWFQRRFALVTRPPQGTSTRCPARCPSLRCGSCQGPPNRDRTPCFACQTGPDASYWLCPQSALPGTRRRSGRCRRESESGAAAARGNPALPKASFSTAPKASSSTTVS